MSITSSFQLRCLTGKSVNISGMQLLTKRLNITNIGMGLLFLGIN